MPMKFIVKLFPEITIKSTPVRKRFIKVLRKNIRTIVKCVDENVDVRGTWDFIQMTTSTNDPVALAEIKDHLEHIPGIAYWMQVSEYPLTTIDDILEKALPVYRERLGW